MEDLFSIFTCLIFHLYFNLMVSICPFPHKWMAKHLSRRRSLLWVLDKTVRRKHTTLVRIPWCIQSSQERWHRANAHRVNTYQTQIKSRNSGDQPSLEGNSGVGILTT